MCKMWLAETNFRSEINNDIFEKVSVLENFSWVEMGFKDFEKNFQCIIDSCGVNDIQLPEKYKN
jgi:hypothetical protein